MQRLSSWFPSLASSPRPARRDPDLVERAMELVFRIERETSVTCGVPPEKDAVLLLIAKLHEGS